MESALKTLIFKTLRLLLKIPMSTLKVIVKIGQFLFSKDPEKQK